MDEDEAVGYALGEFRQLATVRTQPGAQAAVRTDSRHVRTFAPRATMYKYTEQATI
jgi:hypothetical protein